MIFNDIDRWREALKKCHLNESTMPTSRGYLIENVDCYNKIKRILNTPEMEHCHRFLYELDIEDLNEDEIEKVDRLYEVGKERGLFDDEDDITEDTTVDDDGDVADECDLYSQDDGCENPIAIPDVVPTQPPPTRQVQQSPTSSYTVIYSAMKDGNIKTGEAYSDAVSPRSAKVDVMAKLSKFGYENISILAIETSKTDAQKSTDFVPQAFEDDSVVEDDSLEEAKKKEADKKDDAEDSEEKADEPEEEPKDEPAEKPEEKSDDKDDDKDAEKADDKSEKKSSDEKKSDDDDDTLDDGEKSAYKDQYKKAFKAAMLKLNFEKAFDELTLDEKIDVLTELKKNWKDKPEVNKFMTPKEEMSLHATTMKR